MVLIMLILVSALQESEEIVKLYHQPELVDTMYILANTGRVFMVDTANPKLAPTVLVLGGSGKFLDFSCTDGKSLCASTDQGLYCYTINEVRPPPVLVKAEEISGALTLSNLLPLKLADSDKLLFGAFPPTNLKLSGVAESSGTLVTWGMILTLLLFTC
jgi:hypothetical protein